MSGTVLAWSAVLRAAVVVGLNAGVGVVLWRVGLRFLAVAMWLYSLPLALRVQCVIWQGR